MPRRLRIEYPGAIYHIMACGNGRQHIVCDDHDRQRLMDEFARCVNRTSWQVFSFVILSNRLHLMLKTPELNLARSVQRCLSSEAHYFFTHRKVRRSQDRRRHNGRAVRPISRRHEEVAIVTLAPIIQAPSRKHIVNHCIWQYSATDRFMRISSDRPT